MTIVFTDALCTQCGLCCNGTLFADVELGHAEVVRLEAMGMDVDDADRNTGLLSQPCVALRGTRCSIYPHRPKCCRIFQCNLLQDAQQGAVTVERALEHIADAQQQIERLRAMLGRMGNRDVDLPIKERCAETLAADSGTPEQREELEAAMVALEKTIWNTFLGSGKRRE